MVVQGMYMGKQWPTLSRQLPDKIDTVYRGVPPLFDSTADLRFDCSNSAARRRWTGEIHGMSFDSADYLVPCGMSMGFSKAEVLRRVGAELIPDDTCPLTRTLA
jgi:hypothetical protein